MPDLSKYVSRLPVWCMLIFLASMEGMGQTTKVEELLKELKAQTSDTSQIRVMRKLSAAYSSVDPKKKFYYANQYRILAEKNGLDSLVANGYLDMGIAYGIQSKLDSALHYFNLGYEKSKAINFVRGIGRSHANIGYAQDRLDNKKEAVQQYQEALKIFNKVNYRKGINQCITNLGSIYFDLGEYKIADSYFIQVLETFKGEVKDQTGLANALFSLGNSNRKLGNQKKSFEYYRKSLEIREKLGDLNGIALCNWGIGQLYANEGKFDRAFLHFDTALKLNRQLENVYQESVVLMSMAYAFLDQKNYKEAEKTAQLALQQTKLTDSKGLVSDALNLLVDINKQQQKYSEALVYQTDFIKVSDSLELQKTKKDVILTDFNRIRSENKDLVMDNETISSKVKSYSQAIIITSLLLFFVIVLLLLFYKRNRERKVINLLLNSKKEEIEAINEELTAQMDITSAQNIKLERLNTIKNKFFSIVAHDLRSPLANLKMLFGLYRDGQLNREELDELLKQLEENIFTTADFLDNLLEWSKSQLDGIVMKPETFEIGNLLQENVDFIQSQLSRKQLTVEVLQLTPVDVYADRNMINVVIRNLISNCIKFCEPGSMILLDAVNQEENAMITVRDTGVGISVEDQEKIFQLEHTMSKGTTGEKGHHIGLVLCKDMVEQNHGSIWFESQLGKGTTFWITLPKQKPSNQSIAV